jgi:hypothetical protein
VGYYQSRKKRLKGSFFFSVGEDHASSSVDRHVELT